MAEVETVFSEIRAIAEDKISCKCGNNNWKQFLYTGGGAHYVGACKRCGRFYIIEGSDWVLKGGPFGGGKDRS